MNSYKQKAPLGVCLLHLLDLRVFPEVALHHHHLDPQMVAVPVDETVPHTRVVAVLVVVAPPQLLRVLEALTIFMKQPFIDSGVPETAMVSTLTTATSTAALSYDVTMMLMSEIPV